MIPLSNSVMKSDSFLLCDSSDDDNFVLNSVLSSLSLSPKVSIKFRNSTLTSGKLLCVNCVLPRYISMILSSSLTIDIVLDVTSVALLNDSTLLYLLNLTSSFKFSIYVN